MYMYVCISICMNEYICIYVCICMYECMYVYMHTCMCVCICMYVYVCMYVCKEKPFLECMGSGTGIGRMSPKARRAGPRCVGLGRPSAPEFNATT